MKTRKWPHLCMAILTLLYMNSCQDWGEMDPPAGNQVYPKLEKLVTLAFDDQLDPETIQTFAYDEGNAPVIADDEDHGKVLHLDGGYARISNPVTKTKVQNAVSLTFWVKQPEATTGQHPEGALFSFQNEDGTQRLFFTANGWLSYKSVEDQYDNNSPGSGETPIMTPGEWHYVAVIISNNGYNVYVDEKQVIEQTVQDMDFSKIVQFIATCPYFYIGYGSDTQPSEMWIDELSIYRNTITSNEIAIPVVTGETYTPIITVGATDFSTAYFGAHSDVLTATGDCVFHYTFKNYTDGETNWNNWILAITNGRSPKDDDYGAADEYVILRADAYGWGANYNGDNITNDYNWDTFKDDMKGATVDLTIKRVGNRLDINAIATTTSNKTFNYSYFYEGIPTGEIGTFLTLEKAYLEIDVQKTSVGTLYKSGTHAIGNPDYSTIWWGAHSPIESFTDNGAINYQFYNHSNGANAYNNWVIVLTNGKSPGDDGYASSDEYLVLRADDAGWGAYFEAGVRTNDYNMDTFIADMQGAFVDLTVKRIGLRLDIDVVIETKAGSIYNYSFYHTEFATGTLGTFFTTDGTYLDIVSVSRFPFIKGQ